MSSSGVQGAGDMTGFGTLITISEIHHKESRLWLEYGESISSMWTRGPLNAWLSVVSFASQAHVPGREGCFRIPALVGPRNEARNEARHDSSSVDVGELCGEVEK